MYWDSYFVLNPKDPTLENYVVVYGAVGQF